MNIKLLWAFILLFLFGGIFLAINRVDTPMVLVEDEKISETASAE